MSDAVSEADLTAWIDGRLAPARLAEVEAFLDSQPALRTRLAAQASQARALAQVFGPIADEPVPGSLRIAAVRRRPASPIWQAVAAAALLAIGFGGGWLSAPQSPSVGIAALAQEATDSFRVYASDTLRPAELGPDQRALLVRWASTRLGTPVTIPDLDDEGYRFAGGRLVATPHGPAALMLYEGNGRTLALLTRPMDVDKHAPMTITRSDEVARASWSSDGVGYAVVGTGQVDALDPVAQEVQRQMRRSI